MTCSDMTVLTCPPPSCVILPCFLYVQDGRTPVLLAALKGHNSIIELLVDQYHCSLTDVNKVSALDVLQCSHAPLCLVGLMLVPTSLESLFFLFLSLQLMYTYLHMLNPKYCTPSHSPLCMLYM